MIFLREEDKLSYALLHNFFLHAVCFRCCSCECVRLACDAAPWQHEKQSSGLKPVLGHYAYKIRLLLDSPGYRELSFCATVREGIRLGTLAVSMMKCVEAVGHILKHL